MYNSAFYSSNQIAPKFCILNPTSKTLDLTTVKVRYYYTIDGDKEQTYSCDYSSIGEGNIVVSFVKMDKPTDGADHYLEISFKAGEIAPEECFYFATRVWKTDWSDFDQSNDYSYNEAGGDYEDWTKVTGYINGKLEWGAEPGTVIVSPTPASTPTPSVTPDVTYGDVTGDGKVNSIDFAVMRMYLLGMAKDMPGANWRVAADLDCNGSINSIDFAILRSYLLGLIKKLPKVN